MQVPGPSPAQLIVASFSLPSHDRAGGSESEAVVVYEIDDSLDATQGPSLISIADMYLEETRHSYHWASPQSTLITSSIVMPKWEKKDIPPLPTRSSVLRR